MINPPRKTSPPALLPAAAPANIGPAVDANDKTKAVVGDFRAGAATARALARDERPKENETDNPYDPRRGSRTGTTAKCRWLYRRADAGAVAMSYTADPATTTAPTRKPPPLQSFVKLVAPACRPPPTRRKEMARPSTCGMPHVVARYRRCQDETDHIL